MELGVARRRSMDCMPEWSDTTGEEGGNWFAAAGGRWWSGDCQDIGIPSLSTEIHYYMVVYKSGLSISLVHIK